MYIHNSDTIIVKEQNSSGQCIALTKPDKVSWHKNNVLCHDQIEKWHIKYLMIKARRIHVLELGRIILLNIYQFILVNFFKSIKSERKVHILKWKYIFVYQK